MKICFLIGSMAISGGTYVLVQHAAWLRRQGHAVTMAVQERFTAQTLGWHDEISQLRCVPIQEAIPERFDLVIATWWKTALDMNAFTARRYAYFVQSIESRFYPADDIGLRELVDSTYQYPLAFVTEASWIQAHLKHHHARQAALVRNGIRKDIYRPDGPVVAARRARPRILIEGHFGVPFKNTALAVRLAREAGAQDVWLLTGSPLRWLPGIKRMFSQVPMWQTGPIYRSCDILVKLSTVEGMFGPPLEMFHCGGTSVVFDVTGHDEYIVDGVNARVARRGDTGQVVEVLERLLGDVDELSRLKEGALETALAWPDWPTTSRIFGDWVTSIADGDQSPEATRQALTGLSRSAWARYAESERLRLARLSEGRQRRYLRTLFGKLPPPLARGIRQVEAVAEVLSSNRTVY